MLQQILKDMFVDPELLAELDEDQRQTLWCRMREEQVRRWKIWDQQHPNVPPRPPKPRKKRVQWLHGTDGREWVWVMGEHPDDKSIEQILEDEAREAARNLAVKETQQLRLSVDVEITDFIDNNKQILIDSKPKECSHAKLDGLYSSAVQGGDNPTKLVIPMQVSEKRDVLQELSLNKVSKHVSERVQQWEQRVMEERTSVIFKTLQRKKQEAVREAEEASQKQEKLWREQEQKAKIAESEKRDIARRAREEHRRSSIVGMNLDLTSLENNSAPIKQPLSSPFSDSPSALSVTNHFDFNERKIPSKDAIIHWYRTSEFPRGTGLNSDRTSIAPWFHGLITREEAESLLSTRPVGSFLVRLSEKIWGYAISYRAVSRYKHYLIDVSPSHYQFFGANQLSHNSLGELIQYHQRHPITIRGGEILLQSCQREVSVPNILQGLGFEER